MSPKQPPAHSTATMARVPRLGHTATCLWTDGNYFSKTAEGRAANRVAASEGLGVGMTASQVRSQALREAAPCSQKLHSSLKEHIPHYWAFSGMKGRVFV